MTKYYKRRRSFSLVILLTILGVLLCACSSSGDSEETNRSGSSQSESEVSAPADTQSNGQKPETTSDKDNAENESKILIAYFSRAGENYNVGYIKKGNTEIIAEMIADETGGDLFHIQTATPYPEDYDECTKVAKQEQNENARPKLLGDINKLDDYDVIFLGYPNWWGDMPMAVYTFLEGHDFGGKTIIPFCTHEGSGLSNTKSSIESTCSGATVLDGLSIRGSVAQNSQDEAKTAVVKWLKESGVKSDNIGRGNKHER